MGRKRIDANKKKVPFNISIEKEILEKFKAEAEERGEIPSHIIEQFIKKYLSH